VSLLVASSFAPLSILPVLVFFAETCVVTLCTVRTICLTRGRKLLAAGIGFFEVSIWLFAIGQIMQNLTDISCYLAFATGFSLGNYLGVLIEKKLALGSVVVQITTRRSAEELVEDLKSANYGVTMVDAHGATGPVRVVYTVIKRKELERVVSIIKRFDPRAFYAVNDLQAAVEGVCHRAQQASHAAVPAVLRSLFPSVRFDRKSHAYSTPAPASSDLLPVTPAAGGE
jgi:uncharacterized protein YebE (UPF0316 family)